MTRVPCKTCPWRVTTRTEDIPGGGMDHVRSARCHNDFGGIVMACHLSTDDEPYACVGFALRVGFQSVPLRMAAVMGAFDMSECSDGGAELHPTMAAMLAAHPDPLDDGEAQP